MPRNQFVDPGGPLATYNWHINHDTEQEVGRDRALEVSAPTSGIGHVVQQGDVTPLTLTLSGTILDPAQLAAMRAYFDACQSRSVQYLDATGDGYEVIITSFKPTKKRVVRNPRTTGTWTWTYTLSMHVLNVLSGSWAGSPA